MTSLALHIISSLLEVPASSSDSFTILGCVVLSTKANVFCVVVEVDVAVDVATGGGASSSAGYPSPALSPCASSVSHFAYE